MSTPERITLKDERGNSLVFKRTAESKKDGKTLCTYSTDDGKLKADVALADDTLDFTEPLVIERTIARAIADDLLAKAPNTAHERPDSRP